MLSAVSSAFSGLNALQKRFNVTAHNTANALTEGYTKSRVVMEEARSQGVNARAETINTPGPKIERDTLEGKRLVEQSNVEIEDEIVTSMTTTRTYQANLRVVQAEDQRLGNFLDSIASCQITVADISRVAGGPLGPAGNHQSRTPN
jgi:flagellar basal body rod protein FlgG